MWWVLAIGAGIVGLSAILRYKRRSIVDLARNPEQRLQMADILGSTSVVARCLVAQGAPAPSGLEGLGLAVGTRPGETVYAPRLGVVTVRRTNPALSGRRYVSLGITSLTWGVESVRVDGLTGTPLLVGDFVRGGDPLGDSGTVVALNVFDRAIPPPTGEGVLDAAGWLEGLGVAPVCALVRVG